MHDQNERVRFGLVGLGVMGLAHAKTIQSGAVEEAELTAVATRNAEAIAVLRAANPALAVFDTPEAMYKSGLIDAVLIASPHRAHVRQAEEAFAAGMHVLLEKPTGVCTQEVRALNAAAEASGRAFGVMFNQRTNPAYRKMKEIVSSGALGEIRRVNVMITDWFRAQSYYDCGEWRATWRLDGGGVLLNQAPHNLDLFQWICGMPVRLRAFCGFGRWHDVEIEDDVTAYCEYANGATGVFITCTGECPGTNRFEISGDRGQLVYENSRLTLSRPVTPCSVFTREYMGGFGQPEVVREDITPQAEYPMHAGVIRAFARHILFDEPMTAEGKEGINSLMLANAMLLSAWTDRTAELPLDEENEALYARLLAEHAADSRTKTVRNVRMDIGKSF